MASEKRPYKEDESGSGTLSAVPLFVKDLGEWGEEADGLHSLLQAAEELSSLAQNSAHSFEKHMLKESCSSVTSNHSSPSSSSVTDSNSNDRPSQTLPRTHPQSKVESAVCLTPE
jgi:hypothetical protein